MKKIIFAITAATLLFAGNGHHKQNHNNNAKTTKNASSKKNKNQTQPLSQQEIDELIFTREEEKLARDVYITLYNKWHLNIFSNISKSEQKHMDAIKKLLDKYNLPDPVESTGDVVGVFVNEEVQELYNQLVERGLKSEVDALKVGMTIEDMDIKDLQEAIDHSTHNDIINVYENLQKGSRNHLRAFYSQLQQRGEDYEPQYISQEYFDYIVSTPKETGRTK